MWVMVPFIKTFSDPLFAARLLSVFSGFITFLGLTFLGWRFFNKRVGIFSALLMATTPFFTFFDRMALVDSMLAAFSVWALFVALSLIKFPRVDLAMVLGYLYGAALLTKTPALFSILTLPATLIAFDWRANHKKLRLFKLIGLWFVSLVITFVIYNLLRLGPGFSNLSSRNQDYVLSPARILERPWDPFIARIGDLIGFLGPLFGPVIVALILIGIYKSISQKNKYGLVLLFWSLVPLFIQMESLKTFTARYILPVMLPQICLAALGLDLIWSKYLNKSLLKQAAFLVLLLSWSLFFNFSLLTNPEKAPLPKEERTGYLEDWTAGYGLKESAEFLVNQAKVKGAVVVGTRGYFGTLPDGLEIYLDRYNHSLNSSKQVIVQADNSDIQGSLAKTAYQHPTYYITNKSQFVPSAPNLILIKEYPKAFSAKGTQDETLLYQVLPTPNLIQP
jgi:4-amino-4-deoxy-L-arabinose transferase-like glycosyltransferase